MYSLVSEKPGLISSSEKSFSCNLSFMFKIFCWFFFVTDEKNSENLCRTGKKTVERYRHVLDNLHLNLKSFEQKLKSKNKPIDFFQYFNISVETRTQLS